MPRLPGGPARKVCIYFDLILDVVLFPRPELREDKDRQLHFKRASERNDALIELWDCLSQRMPREEGKAPTLVTRKKKARLLDNKGKIFVLKFVVAYGQSAAKPYTHMVIHLEDMQLAVEVKRVAHMTRSGILTLTHVHILVGRPNDLLWASSRALRQAVEADCEVPNQPPSWWHQQRRVSEVLVHLQGSQEPDDEAAFVSGAPSTRDRLHLQMTEEDQHQHQ
jgi:hypothetical protein